MKLIDKKINMWSCTLGELTYRQICILKAGLGGDSVLSEFESFFDDKTGQIGSPHHGTARHCWYGP